MLTDRLVTRSGQQFDALANKNLIYLAKDALVVIGYTGLAYLDGIPTDQWIAQKLSGERFEGDDLLKPPLRFKAGPPGPWPDIGKATFYLMHEMAAAIARLPLQHRKSLRHTVVLAGWQNARRRVRPVGVWFDYSAAKGKFVLSRTSRYWQDWRGSKGQRPFFFWAHSPGHLSTAEQAQLNGRIAGATSIDEVEEIMLEGIRLGR